MCVRGLRRLLSNRTLSLLVLLVEVKLWKMSREVRVEIVGLMKVNHFQVAKSIAEGLKQKFPGSFVEPHIRPLLELDWNMYLTDKKQELKGEMLQYKGNLVCFVNGQLIGDEKDLSRWAEKQWQFTFYRPPALYAAITDEYYHQHLLNTGHVFVYMDVEIGGEAAGRLLFELFSDLCPKTCKNFKALCTGEAGMSQNQLMLSYKNSLFHRVVPGAGCKEEILLQLGRAMVENPFMVQRLEMRVLLYLTTSEGSWEWPTKDPIVTVLSSTSPYSQPYGWIEIMWHLGKLLKAQKSLGD